MCVTCGCSDDGDTKITNLEKGDVATMDLHNNDEHHTHILADGTVITHLHHHSHRHEQVSHESANTHAKLHGTTISLEADILAKNNLIAAQNRGWFKGRNILALNLMSSPGAGKTTLLTRTINDLKEKLLISVIEGDQETINDAKKIQETGSKVVQINTGTGCHLDAAMVDKGLQELNPPLNSLVMIENVGNLVCPALFDLGESAKVVILSVTEGEDKPIKYPHIFRASQVMIITKTDLLPYIEFDIEKCVEYARQVNPQIKIFQVSVKNGEGLNSWYEWLMINISGTFNQ
ncbi:hydrogenase nickel incorporation protein HypB [Calothrix sp. UHCC 0171]|uniref:hydrogenase nickel incorporation protein HypB n=1 Tax=Calothrix sp. UHCC 0171 TaxID=3110245 RepID=UPI002B20D051|nr:hydrogenase nickel incorporation protein HypB [Calothrix sp. UHCC 0171]MEA5570081.1 hydrogenase nickel incorporation protein HypB [Calothrix sp. UHCC 0171]